MMPSRGMGAIAPVKVPKRIKRKDDPNTVEVYAAGGVVKRKPKPKKKP